MNRTNRKHCVSNNLEEGGSRGQTRLQAGRPGARGPQGRGRGQRPARLDPAWPTLDTSFIRAKKWRPPQCLHVRETIKGFMLQSTH